jgi:hypothetical protein
MYANQQHVNRFQTIFTKVISQPELKGQVGNSNRSLSVVHLAVGKLSHLLAHRDDCPESYCHDPSVGVSVGVIPRGKKIT